MRRLRQLAPVLLFAAFFVSALACIPASRSQSLPLSVLCAAAACASFVGLAIWVRAQSRSDAGDVHRPALPEPVRIVSRRPRVGGGPVRYRPIGSLRAALLSLPPWRQRRWDAFEREYRSYVGRSTDLRRRSR